MHLGHVTILVSEYEPAINFFVDAPGFKLAEDSPAMTNNGCPKQRIRVTRLQCDHADQIICMSRQHTHFGSDEHAQPVCPTWRPPLPWPAGAQTAEKQHAWLLKLDAQPRLG